MLNKFITRLKARKILKEVNKIKSIWINASIRESIKYNKTNTELFFEITNTWNIEKDLSRLLKILMDLSVKYSLYFYGRTNEKLEIKIDVRY